MSDEVAISTRQCYNYLVSRRAKASKKELQAYDRRAHRSAIRFRGDVRVLNKLIKLVDFKGDT